jgi:hypothetical protein
LKQSENDEFEGVPDLQKRKAGLKSCGKNSLNKTLKHQ